MSERLSPKKVLSEFEGVELEDARLERRLALLVERVAANPHESFPVVMKSGAEREALYRFLSNDQVTLHRLIAGHVRETHERMGRDPVVRVVHDTTALIYKGEREGLGPIKHRGRGFFAHCALAVSADERSRPLGVLDVSCYVNPGDGSLSKLTKAQQTKRLRSMPREAKQSSRWEALAASVSSNLPSGIEAIHVMDQEADDFVLLGELLKIGCRFVVRGSGTRMTGPEKVSLEEVLSTQPAQLFRKVHVNRRLRKGLSNRPLRSERDAELSVRWADVVLPKSAHLKYETRQLSLTVVHVFEHQPPEGEERLEWYLLTNEPVRNVEEAGCVIDHYRARWKIEEFFKALKTGCAVEKRQLTNLDALTRTLGLFIPIAWNLLALRDLAHEIEARAATELLSRDDLAVLKVLVRQRRNDHVLPENPTAKEAFLAIAAIGGHIRNNGDPGWLVLGRGYQTFLDARAIWCAARCDQS